MNDTDAEQFDRAIAALDEKMSQEAEQIEARAALVAIFLTLDRGAATSFGDLADAILERFSVKVRR
jgi:hypothetical protein